MGDDANKLKIVGVSTDVRSVYAIWVKKEDVLPDDVFDLLKGCFL